MHASITNRAPDQPVIVLGKVKRAKRPKLTVELLKGPKGLPALMTDFPVAFRAKSKVGGAARSIRFPAA